MHLGRRPVYLIRMIQRRLRVCAIHQNCGPVLNSLNEPLVAREQAECPSYIVDGLLRSVVANEEYVQACLIEHIPCCVPCIILSFSPIIVRWDEPSFMRTGLFRIVLIIRLIALMGAAQFKTKIFQGSFLAASKIELLLGGKTLARLAWR